MSKIREKSNETVEKLEEVELDKLKRALARIATENNTSFFNKKSDYFYFFQDEVGNHLSIDQSVSRIKKDKNDDQLDLLTETFNRLSESISAIEKENTSLKEIIFDLILQPNLEEKRQYIPIEIYVDTKETEKIFEVYSSVLDLTKELGFEKIIDLPPIIHSWFKKIIATSKKVMTSEEVMERFKEVEYGIEVNTILKQQSEIDKNHSEALENVIKSLSGIDNVAIRIGSLIVVKITDESTGSVNLQVRTLSIKEMYVINKNPNIMSTPKLVLEYLSKAIELDSKLSEN